MSKQIRQLSLCLVLLLSATNSFSQNSRPAVWASEDSSTAITLAGSRTTINGLVHSNGGIKITGSRHTVSGGITWVSQYSEKGNFHSFDPSPIQTSEAIWPLNFAVQSYMPGGSAAVAAGPHYHDYTEYCASNNKLQINKQSPTLSAGLYWVPCDIKISGSVSLGSVTFISSGEIHISGSNVSQESAYVDNISIMTASSDAKAVKLSGANMALTGEIIAPNSDVQLTGSSSTLSCGIYAQQVSIAGSRHVIGGGDCDGGSSNGSPPIADDASISLAEDTSSSFTLTGSDTDGDLLSYVVTAPPSSGTITGTAPDLTYTPNDNFNGTDSLQFIVNDGASNSSPATVSIVVSPANDVPVAFPQSLTVNENGSLAITLNGEDIDADALSFLVINGPANGQITGVAPDIVYTPTADYFGEDSFEFLVNDGISDSTPASVLITVVAVNTEPVALSAAYSLQQNTSLSIELEGSDSDGDSLTYSIVTDPQHGQLSGTPPTITYQPSSGYFGADELVFQISDGNGGTDSGTISIQVLQNSNTPPVADAGPDRTSLPGEPVFIAGSGFDEDNDTLSYSWNLISKPSESTVAPFSVGIESIEFSADISGTYVFGLVVNDGTVDSAQDVMSLIVNEVQAPPNARAVYLVQRDRLEREGFVFDARSSTNSLDEPDSYQDLLYTWKVLQPAGATLIDRNGNPVREFSENAAPFLLTNWGVSEVVVSLVVTEDGVSSAPTLLTVPVDAVTPPTIVSNSAIDIGLGQSADILINVFTDQYFDGGGCCPRSWRGQYSVQWSVIESPVGSFATLIKESDSAEGADYLSPSFDNTITPDIAGTYLIGVTVDNGFSNGQSQAVVVVRAADPTNSKPVASIAGGVNQSVVVDASPVDFTLDGSASTDIDGDSLEYSWSIEAPYGSRTRIRNSSSSLSSFTADVRGNYIVRLEVSDGQQVSDVAQVVVSAEGSQPNNPPVAVPGEYTNWVANDRAQLDAFQSFDVDNDPILYRWSLVAAPAAGGYVLPSLLLSEPGSSSVDFKPNVAGQYRFELTVSDWKGTTSATVDIDVAVANIPPIADNGYEIGERVFIQRGQQVPLNASNSYDPDGQNLTYNWVITTANASDATIASSTDAVTTFTSDTVGQYTVALRVSDGEDTRSRYLWVYVLNDNNLAPVTSVPELLTADVGEFITIDASASFDPDGDEFWLNAYRLLSAPQGVSVLLYPRDRVTFNFKSDVPGVYTIGFNHTDGLAVSSTDTVDIIVGNAMPVAKASADSLTTATPGVVHLNGTRSTDSRGFSNYAVFSYIPAVDFQWSLVAVPSGSQANFDDASASTPKLSLDLPGEYKVQLIVSDQYASSEPTTLTIIASGSNDKPIANAGDDIQAFIGDTIQLNGSNSSDPDQDALTYRWSIVSAPAASTSTIQNSTNSVAQLLADEAGDYILSLVVNDGLLDSETDFIAITVLDPNANQPPTASFIFLPQSSIPQLVQMDGTASSDPDADTLSFKWEITSRPIESVANVIGSGAQASFYLDLEGDYIVSLIVSDGILESVAMNRLMSYTLPNASLSSINITYPSMGNLLQQLNTPVIGTFASNLDNPAIFVNERPTCTYNGVFVHNELPLASDLNIVTAEMIDQNPAAVELETLAETFINFNAAGDEYFVLNLSNYCVTGPTEVEFTLGYRSALVDRVELDTNGDGAADITLSDDNLSEGYLFANEGINSVSAKAILTGGGVAGRNLYVVVRSDEVERAAVLRTWSGFRKAFDQGDLDKATSYFSAEQRDAYLTSLQSVSASGLQYMSDAFDTFSEVEINASTAVFGVQSEFQGQTTTTLITFVKDLFGVWRIFSF